MAGFLTTPSPNQESRIEAPTEAATEPITELATEPITEQVVWYAFYNPSMLRDNDTTNDYNFGYDPNPMHENRTPEFYHNDLKNRMLIDPALAAAEMGACDYVFGTRFIGDCYDVCQDWIEAMNMATNQFMAMGKSAYLMKLDKFFDFINALDKRVEYRYRIRPLLMNPFTSSGVPRIEEGFVEGEGFCLVYSSVVNGQTRELVLRIDCGYPPVKITDVAEPTTQFVPEPQPEPVPVPTEPETIPVPTTTEPETATTAPVVIVPKSPEEASYEYLEPNGFQSSEEVPQNSVYYSTYDEYKAYMEDLQNNPAGEWGFPQD